MWPFSRKKQQESYAKLVVDLDEKSFGFEFSFDLHGSEQEKAEFATRVGVMLAVLQSGDYEPYILKSMFGTKSLDKSRENAVTYMVSKMRAALDAVREGDFVRGRDDYENSPIISPREALRENG